MNLYEKTLSLIKNRPARISLQQITDDLNKKNIEVSYSWICKFHQGEITNPSYLTLQALHDYLVSVVKH